MNDPKTAPIQMHTNISAISGVFVLCLSTRQPYWQTLLMLRSKSCVIGFPLLDLKADVLVSI